jgi:hypothetical protein
MIIILVTSLVLLTISIGINISLGVLSKIHQKKIAFYEKEILKSDAFVVSMRELVVKSLSTMREIDKQGVFSSRISEKGLFESDDMVGTIFLDLTQVVEELNKNIEELQNEKK